jgi:rhomboid protease GluP
VAGTAAGGGGRAGEALYARGALYAPLILKGQDFYRLLSAVFLHADAAHLVNNMIVQFAAGTILERRAGHAGYAAVYLLSGIAGNLVSVGTDYQSGSYGYSVGASGAVFGVLGALIFLITRMTVRSLRRQKHSSVWYQGGGAGSGDRAGRKYRSLLLRTGIMTAYLVYSGWSNPVINQAAHIGGLVCGFILCAVLMMTRPDVDLNELLQ